MREGGIADSVPIVMAGGVWYLREWERLDRQSRARQIAFQFGTRPLLTRKARSRRCGRRAARRSSRATSCCTASRPPASIQLAVRNTFLRASRRAASGRSAYSKVEAGEHTVQLDVGVKAARTSGCPEDDLNRARAWHGAGFTEALKTPDDTLVFVAPRSEDDPQGPGRLHGLPVALRLLVWKDHDDYTTGRLADPRSFCIQKTLQDIAHGATRTTT
jgi:nitronate monooxygenase